MGWMVQVREPEVQVWGGEESRGSSQIWKEAKQVTYKVVIPYQGYKA